MRVGRVAMVAAAWLTACGGGGPGASGEAVEALTPPGLPVLARSIGAATEVTGTVEVRHAGYPYWQEVKQGMAVRLDDWVRTRVASTVRLEFSNGTSLDVEERSVVVVELPEAPADGGVASTSEAAVVVSEGSVRATASAEDDAPAPLLVKSRGTTQRLVASPGQRAGFRLRASERGTEIAVTEGTATVQRGNESVELAKGQATVAASVLSMPVEVPDFPVSVAPGIDARAFFPPSEALKLTWKPVAGVKGYRLQLARDLSFSVDARTVDVDGTSYPFRPEAKGLYVWRVASKASGGVMGEYGFARRIYFEDEAPRELLLTPEDGEVFGYLSDPPAIVFQWQAAAGAASYRLSIAAGPDPQRKPVVVETTQAQRIEINRLTAGEYTWGIYVRPGMKPIFLSPRKLVVKLMPKPKVKAPNAIRFE